MCVKYRRYFAGVTRIRNFSGVTPHFVCLCRCNASSLFLQVFRVDIILFRRRTCRYRHTACILCRAGNHLPTGSSWGGDLNWVGCDGRRSSRMVVVVTRAWKDDFAPSIQKVSATLIFSWVKDGRTMTTTEQVEGRYDFGSHAMDLQATPGGHISADFKCTFIDDNYCHGVLYKASTDTICAHVILSSSG